MKFLFVVNGSAARVNAPALRSRLVREFQGQEISIVQEAPSRSVLEAANPKPVVVAVGGDGTVQHVLHRGGGPFPCALGVLPLGTANDLARACGIPSDLTAACAVLRLGHTRSIDLVEVNGVPFVTSGGLGLPASVASRAGRLRDHPLVGPLVRRLRRNAYLVSAVVEVLRGAEPVVASVEGVAGHGGPSHAAILVSNLPLLGGFRPSPDADPCDGRVDLCVIESPRSRLRLVRLVARIRQGNVASSPEASTARTRSTTVISARPVAFLGDGEILARGTRFRIRVRPGGVRLVCPAERGPADVLGGRGCCTAASPPCSVPRSPATSARERSLPLPEPR